MALSFATDIRPLFRETPDVDAMKPMGLDLWSYDDVKQQAIAIHSRLEDGSMPCDGAWPEVLRSVPPACGGSTSCSVLTSGAM